MLPYYSAYILMLFAAVWLSAQGRKDGRKKERSYCIFFAIVWICLLGLRHPSMGIDLQYGAAYGYLGRFLYIDSNPLKELLKYGVQNYEPGFIIFCKCLGLFGDNYQILLIGCAIATIVPIAVWIFINSSYPYFSTIIYLGLPSFLINYSGLRQGIAISITVWAFEMIKKRKLLWFVAFVLLAASFHQSAIMFIVAYPVYHIRMNKGASLLTIVALPFTYVLRVPLFRGLSKLLKENAEIDNNGAVTLFIVFWLIYLFAIFFGHENDQEELGTRNIFFLACLCQVFSGVSNTAMRVGYYFMIILVILLPQIVSNTYKMIEETNGRRSSMIMYLGITFSFAVFGLYSISRGSWAMSNPYLFFWQ